MLQVFERERMVRRKFLTVLCALFLFSLLILSNQTVIAGTEAQALVETSWLADNLKNPGLAIVYVGGPASKKENFELKHVPGAVYLDFGTLMGILGDGSTPPDKAKFKAPSGILGIGNDKHVIVHSGDTLFLHERLSFSRLFRPQKGEHIMNGAVTKWMNEGHTDNRGEKNNTCDILQSKHLMLSPCNR